MVMEAAIGDGVLTFSIATKRDTALGFDLYSFWSFLIYISKASFLSCRWWYLRSCIAAVQFGVLVWHRGHWWQPELRSAAAFHLECVAWWEVYVLWNGMRWCQLPQKKSSVRGYWKVSVIAVRDSALLTLSAENYTLDVGTLGLGEIPTNRFSSNKHTQAGLCVYVTWCVHQVHLIVYPANVHVRGLDHGNLQYYYQRVNITQPVADAGYTGTIRCDYVMRGVRQ